jgi:hypothetical protein
MIDKRRRFDGVINSVSVTDQNVVFAVSDDSEKRKLEGGIGITKSIKKSKGKDKKSLSDAVEVTVTVPFINIERARLIPEI